MGPQEGFKHFKVTNFRPEQTPPTESTRPSNNRGRQDEPHNRYVRITRYISLGCCGTSNDLIWKGTSYMFFMTSIMSPNWKKNIKNWIFVCSHICHILCGNTSGHPEHNGQWSQCKKRSLKSLKSLLILSLPFSSKHEFSFFKLFLDWFLISWIFRISSLGNWLCPDFH